MPKNFLILFTAREGSSPIVAGFSGLKFFQVPLMEEFDKFWIDEFYNSQVDLPALFDSTYSSGTLNLDDMWGRRNFIYYDESKPERLGREKLSVGFKWRPHGDLNQIIHVLAKHNVTVFYLVRRDFRELVCSLYLSEAKISGTTLGHSQFKLANAAPEEKEALATKLNNIKRSANPVKLAKISAKRVARAYLNARVLAKCKRAGIETDLLYYEDFVEDPKAFFAKMADTLENSAQIDKKAQVPKPLKKVNKVPAKARVSGSDSGLSNAVIGLSASIYNTLLRQVA